MERTLKTTVILFRNKPIFFTFHPPPHPKSSDKEPCQSSQTSLEGDQSPDSPTTPTSSLTTPLPVPRKESALEAPREKKPGSDMVVPVPAPRQNASSKHQEPLEDRDAAMEANSSKNSTKTSSLDSGIEDGKTTPTSVEEKVLF